MDERPYFTKVEEKRGRTGHHIDAGFFFLEERRARRYFGGQFDSDGFAATPNSNTLLNEHFKRYAAFMESQGHRVTLSGLGGEEATGGGVPTPIPELRDLLARGLFLRLGHQLRAWATKMRRHPLPLLGEVMLGFLPFSSLRTCRDIPQIPWLHPRFISRHRAAFHRSVPTVTLFGPLASFTMHLNELDVVRRLLAYVALEPRLLRDVRYPYLDRDFLEFVFAVPQEQLVRVGQRRSLMKRALVGILPGEILNRRKIEAIKQDGPADISTEWPDLEEIARHYVSAFTQIIDTSRFSEVLQSAQQNREVFAEDLRRTLTLQSWLCHLTMHGMLLDSAEGRTRPSLLGADNPAKNVSQSLAS